MRTFLLAAVVLWSSASAAEPAAFAPGTARADAGELPDCPSAECPPRQMGMPNWECADGRRGGPVCKRGLDGRCGWMVVDCPAAESRPPPAPPIKKTKGCGKLPDVATLLRWPVQTYGGCSGGIPNPRAPKPVPPVILRVLPDGSKIIDAGARGCIRAVERECFMK